MAPRDGAVRAAWGAFPCLVLSLPDALAQRNLLTDIVYGVILVTLLGQGLALRTLLPRWKDKLVRAEVVETLPTKV